MSATRRGLIKFREWCALLDEQGWSREDKRFLCDYWWKHHDDDGVIYPSGVTRPDDVSPPQSRSPSE